MEGIKSFRGASVVVACSFMFLAVTPKSSSQTTARPAIQDLNPKSATAGTSDISLTIDGSGFVPPAPPGSLSVLPGDGSQVQWNGTLLKTTFNSTTMLTAFVPAALMANPGTITITVVNPGQIVSNAGAFTVTTGGGKPLALAIKTPTPLPNGTTGAMYAQGLTAEGGSPPYTWSITAGQPPPGITLISTSGVLSGTPTASGNFSFTVQVADSAGVMTSKGFSVTIGSPGSAPLMIYNSPSLPDGEVRKPYSLTLTASGGNPPYNWSIAEDFLPPGLRLDSLGGVIVGTPTTAGTFNFVVRVSDSAQNTIIKSFLIQVRLTLPVLAGTTPPVLPQATLGGDYSAMLSASGGVPPYRWELSSGSLPPGLTLDSSGLIRGVPTAAGAYSFNAVVTDTAQATAAFEFTLTVSPPGSISAVVNGASFLPGGLAPGTIISIFGSEIGPAGVVGLQLASSGRVATLLGGARVLFDGVPAPLISVQARQVNAVVPYEVAGKSGAAVQIEFQGKLSEAVTVPLRDSSPGLFTLDSSGKGQGAILNGDGALNSESNPAPKGSVVVLYATGAGQTDPPGVSGSIAAEPWQKPRLSVSVTIGGLPAEILYAGAAPGLLAGLLQLNVRTPEGAPSGSAVPVALTIGSVTSQQDVTVALR